jgi:hypothetical protein
VEQGCFLRLKRGTGDMPNVRRSIDRLLKSLNLIVPKVNFFLDNSAERAYNTLINQFTAKETNKSGKRLY